MPRLRKLQAGVHERAAAIAARLKHGIQHLERHQQPRARIASVVGGRRDHVQRGLVAPVEHGRHQLVLGREVVVERHLAHLRLGRYPLHAHRPDALRVEQPRRRLQHSLARLHWVKTSLV
jgi:hypothetical protein